MDFNKKLREKARWQLNKDAVDCSKLVLEVAPHKNSSYRATYRPSHKPSESDEQDMLGTVGKVRTNS